MKQMFAVTFITYVHLIVLYEYFCFLLFKYSADKGYVRHCMYHDSQKCRNRYMCNSMDVINFSGLILSVSVFI